MRSFYKGCLAGRNLAERLDWRFGAAASALGLRGRHGHLGSVFGGSLLIRLLLRG